GTSTGVCEYIDTVKVESATQVPPNWDAEVGNWVTLGSGTRASVDTNVDVEVVARELHVHLTRGIRSDFARLVFPCLQRLHIALEDWCESELGLVDRLLSEAAPTLVLLELTLKGSFAITEPLRPREVLSSLRTVRVDWASLSLLECLKSATPPQQVRVVVNGYVGSQASDEELAQASGILGGSHWARIAFVDSPLQHLLRKSSVLRKICADGSGHEHVIEQRRTHLKEALNMPDIEFI
ncbi:hypothetical protein EV714DRAFT_213909, partial [Schizophyllum commune]